jgi:hypothetical protein
MTLSEIIVDSSMRTSSQPILSSAGSFILQHVDMITNEAVVESGQHELTEATLLHILNLYDKLGCIQRLHLELLRKASSKSVGTKVRAYSDLFAKHLILLVSLLPLIFVL